MSQPAGAASPDTAGPVERIGRIARLIESSGDRNEALGLAPEVVDALHGQRIFSSAAGARVRRRGGRPRHLVSRHGGARQARCQHRLVRRPDQRMLGEVGRQALEIEFLKPEKRFGKAGQKESHFYGYDRRSGDLPRHIRRAGGWTPGARNRSRPVAFHLDVSSTNGRGVRRLAQRRSEGERWPSTLSVPRYTLWTCSPPY